MRIFALSLHALQGLGNVPIPWLAIEIAGGILEIASEEIFVEAFL